MSKSRKLTTSRTVYPEETLLTYGLRLRKMIRCRTVSQKDSYDDTEFAGLRAVMEELFPLVHLRMEKRTFGDDCWIYRLKGRDSGRAIMLMSHHDVVEAGDGWQHDPFGGEILDGRIWGRGTVDTKTPLFAEFSALEELLESGFEPPCDVYLGSSHNEELAGDGIPKALEWFREQGITFEVILDEGGAVIEPPLGGMKCEKCAMVAVHEKGRCKLHLTASSDGGHAGLTAAAKATPVERMAGLIGEISKKRPFIRRLNPQVTAMFTHLAPYCGFPMKQLLGNLWLFGGVIKAVMPKLNPQAGGLIGTMCTFSEISGSGKLCTATAMLRGVDRQDLQTDLENLKKLAAAYGVEVQIADDSEYHDPADMTRPAFSYLMDCLAVCFPQYPAAPMILPAGTDARHFTEICPCVLRFAPITLSAQQLASVHGAEENLDLRSVAEAVGFYRHFLRNYR